MSTASNKQKASTNATPAPPRSAKRAVSTLSKRPPGACFQTLVTIEVGATKKKFIIHKDLLTFYSDYFRGALDGSFREAVEAKLHLAEESVEIFEIFNRFIYTRCLADGEGHKLSWEQLVEIWLFGDKHLIPSLQNSTIDALMLKNRIENIIPTNNIKIVWENTLPSSPLRKIILDQIVYGTDINKILTPDYEHRWTTESLMDLAKAIHNKEAAPDKYRLPKRGKCYYHIHNEGEEC